MSTQNAPRNLSLDRKPTDSGPNSSHGRNPIPSNKPFRARIAVLLVAVLALGLAASLNGVGPRAGLVNAFSESINTLSADCETPKTVWDLGQTACAAATGATGQRRIFWITPDGSVADVSNPFSGTASDTYTFETTGPLAQYGTWTVRTVDDSGSGFAVASFLVRNAAVDNVDLVVSIFGPDKATAGGAVSYRIEILNRGPNVAQNVVLTETVPNNSTFASEAQDSGPGAICGNPDGGQTGTSTCTIPNLAANESAVFIFVYNVNEGTPVETIIANTASVASSTNELFQNDNTARNQVQVAPGTGSPACTINCPADISVNNNAGDPNPCVKAVTYTTPTASGGCADPDTGQIPAVVCSPPSGADFPIGASSVVCSTGSTTCSFTITVNETRAPTPPALNCPANMTVSENSPGSGTAIVNYPAPATTGNCVVVVCNPASGSEFNLGTTTVMCTGTDSSNATANCSFDITVVSGDCILTCPDDITQDADAGQCSAVVNYPAPITSGGCGGVICNPPSGSVFPAGTTPVSCTSGAGPSCGFSVIVNSSSSLTALGAAKVWVGLKNSDDVGTKFDLLAEVLRNGSVVGSGEVDDVAGGSSGFNNAILRTINLALDGSAGFCAGDNLSFRLSVRIAASSGHVSGTARLWFNDSAANSSFNATVAGTASDYFLWDGFLLNTTAGPGPKKTMDVLVNRNVGGNPFKPFGTWTKTF